MVDGSGQRDYSGMWGLSRHSLSVTCRRRRPSGERNSLSAVALLLFDNEAENGRLSDRILAPKVTCRWRRRLSEPRDCADVHSRNARILQVRHRSYATYSRQPRQVRKEATVTGSCVCSEPPVPDFFGSRRVVPALLTTRFTYLYELFAQETIPRASTCVRLGRSIAGPKERNEESYNPPETRRAECHRPRIWKAVSGAPALS